MSAYAVVVALECVTVGLAGLLVFQLYRVAKRNPIQSETGEESVPILTDEVIEVAGVEEKSSPRLNAMQFAVEEAPLPQGAISVSNTESKEQYVVGKAPATDLLSDYIGEFFTDDVQSDLSEMRSVPEASETLSTEAQTDDVDNAALLLKMRANDSVSGDVVLEEETKTEELAVVRPVILNEHERVHVETAAADSSDGDVITVSNVNEVGIVTGTDKTMSGKVVHAMLSEAEIVCAS